MDPRSLWLKHARPRLTTCAVTAAVAAACVLAAGCEPRRPSDPKPPSDPGRNLPKPITAVVPAALRLGL